MNNELVSGFDDIQMNECEMSLTHRDDVLIIRMTGQLNTYNSTPFQKKTHLILSTSFRKLIFNLSGINYVSSTGIGAFTQILKEFSKDSKPGIITLAEIQPKVYEVFQLLGFTTFFRIFDTADSAVAHFQNHQEISMFPKILNCPLCNIKLKALKSGKFRCSKCRSILVIDSNAKIFIEK